MLRINPGFIGNLTQVQILLYLATIQEMVKKKKGFFKVRERSGNFTQSRGKFLFFREVRENRIFVTNSRKEPSLFLSTREDESLFTNFQ